MISASPIRLDPRDALAGSADDHLFGRERVGARAVLRQELADARRRGFGPVPGFGSSSYLVVGPQPGALGVYAKVRGTILELDVGPATDPIARYLALSLARRIAGKI